MIEVTEYLNTQSAIPLETPPQEMLATETATDTTLAELTATVDRTYAEAGLEDALADRIFFKLRGGDDVKHHERQRY